jgi:hypothetical protein
MDPNETLLTIAEISIAVIGFAGIVSALRPRSSSLADAMHRLRMRIMLETAAYVMVISFFPLLLEGLELPQRSVWAVGSGLLAITAPIQVASIYLRQRSIFGSALLRETLLFDASTIVLAFFVEGALVANALGLFFEPRFAGYMVGVLFPLWAALAMFIRAILASEELVFPNTDEPPPEE